MAVMRAILAGFVLSVALAGTASGTADGPSGSLVRQFLEATEAQEIDCPAGLDAYGTAQDAVCATTGQPLKALKKQLKALIRRRDDVVPLAGSLWTARHEYELARFFVGRELFVLRVDPRDGGLALMPHQSCFNPATLERAAVSTIRDAGVAAPALTEKPGLLDYPAAARVERSNGFAMVQLVVSGEGAVTDACVLYVTPEGLGFREEALPYASQFRYRPGTRDGLPARILVNESLTWEIR